MWEGRCAVLFSAEKLGNFAAPIVTAPAQVGVYTFVGRTAGNEEDRAAQTQV